MTLVSEVIYETGIKELKDISPESVLSMLLDVKKSINRIDSSFADANLLRVLSIVETGKYEVNGDVLIRIDLSSAKKVIEAYRRYSEGGCRSCVSLGVKTIDAQDGAIGWYCEVYDQDYDANATGCECGVRYKGFSPKVKDHYDSPCKNWKPLFSPGLEKIVGEGNKVNQL